MLGGLIKLKMSQYVSGQIDEDVAICNASTEETQKSNSYEKLVCNLCWHLR
jgi:hypothetical protein